MSKHLRMILTIVALVMAMLATGVGTASATPVAAVSTSTVSTAGVSAAQIQLGSIWDCKAAAKNAGGAPWNKVYAATRAPGCIQYLGNQTANFICWADDQWWGGWARWIVWQVTGGQTNRC